MYRIRTQVRTLARLHKDDCNASSLENNMSCSRALTASLLSFMIPFNITFSYIAKIESKPFKKKEDKCKIDSKK